MLSLKEKWARFNFLRFRATFHSALPLFYLLTQILRWYPRKNYAILEINPKAVFWTLPSSNSAALLEYPSAAILARPFYFKPVDIVDSAMLLCFINPFTAKFSQKQISSKFPNFILWNFD